MAEGNFNVFTLSLLLYVCVFILVLAMYLLHTPFGIEICVKSKSHTPYGIIPCGCVINNTGHPSNDASAFGLLFLVKTLNPV